MASEEFSTIFGFCFWTMVAGIILVALGIEVPLGIAMIVVPFPLFICIALSVRGLQEGFKERERMKRVQKQQAGAESSSAGQQGSIKSAFEEAGVHLLLEVQQQQAS